MSYPCLFDPFSSARFPRLGVSLLRRASSEGLFQVTFDPGLFGVTHQGAVPGIG